MILIFEKFNFLKINFVSINTSLGNLQIGLIILLEFLMIKGNIKKIKQTR